MRTAPAPNIPAIPGMNPGAFVMGGGGDGGGSGAGSGSGSGKNQGADGNSGGESANGDGRDACGGAGGDGGGCPNHHNGAATGAASRGDPIDVVTGRVFTVPTVEVALGGPMQLLLRRAYSSAARSSDVGLGFGWSHSFAWSIEVGRRDARVCADDGTSNVIPTPPVGGGSLGPHGWVLVRDEQGYVLDRGNDTWLVFDGSGLGTHLLTAVRDRHGNQITLRYRDGRLDEIVDSVGRVVRVRRQDSGQIRAFELLTAREGGAWVAAATYGYDDRGDLVSATDADGYTARYVYDDAHRLVAWTAPTGVTFHYRYDENGKGVETWGVYPDGVDPALSARAPRLLADETTVAKGVHHVKIERQPDGYAEVVDSVTVQRYFGNALGKVDKAVSAGGVFSRTYDERGHLASFTDPLGATTRWVRDSRGRELSVTDALGRVTTLERDSEGALTRVIDAAGGETDITTSADGIRWKDPIGATFEVAHDARGLTTRTVAPNGAVTRRSYDEYGNLVEIVDGTGRTRTMTYDYWGRCTSVRDGSGGTTRYVRSHRGDLLEVHHADGGVTRYAYDGLCNLVALSAPDGQTTRFQIGGWNRLAAIEYASGAKMSLGYDREGRLVDVTNPRGEAHRIERNAAGLPVVEVFFDGRKVSYGYDLLGRSAWVVAASGERTELEHDPAGNLVRVAYDDGTADVYEYNERNELVSVESPAADLRFERNAVGWIVRETATVGGEATTLAREYDSMGNALKRVTSLGHVAEWARDACGRPTRVTLDGELGVDSTFDGVGREVRRMFSAGGRMDFVYDAIGRMVAQRVSVGRGDAGAGEPDWVGPIPANVTVERRYRWSGAADLAEAWDQVHGRTQFEYDHLGQLLGVVPAHLRGELFTYDAAGNVSEVDRAGAPRRTYGRGDRLLSKDSEQLEYDDDGRIAMRSQRRGDDVARTRYQWNAAGRLARVERPDGAVVELAYDPFGRRVSKTLLRRAAGTIAVVATTRFVWDGAALVHEIKKSASESGDPVVEERTYCFEEDRVVPFAHRDGPAGGRWFFYVNDPSGTPQRLVDAAGDVACDLVSTPWGHAEAAPGSRTTTPLRFSGQYEDPETGLSYNRHRYYDPGLGRYVSPDPIGLAGGANAYQYADNKPTTIIDPNGLFPQSTIVGAPGGPIRGRSAGQQPPGTSPVQDPAVTTAVRNAQAARGAPVSGSSGCAEVDALHQMAAGIRSEGRLGNGPAADEEVRKRMQQQFRDGAKLTTTGDGKNPGQMAPCTMCAQVMRELGLHPQNINLDGEAQGGVVGPNPPRPNPPPHFPGAWNGQLTQQGPTRAPTTRGSGTTPSRTPPFTGT